jgi:hypothetical protein
MEVLKKLNLRVSPMPIVPFSIRACRDAKYTKSSRSDPIGFLESNNSYIRFVNYRRRGVDLKTTTIALLLALCLLGFFGSAKVEVSQAFYPTGYIGDWGDIKLEENSTDNPHTAPDCIKITYSAVQSEGKGFAGVCWQYPDSNTGDQPGRIDLVNSTKVTFWACGALGGETAEFKVGGGASDSIQPAATTGVVTLSKDWQQYSIDLTSKDPTNVVSGFCWTTTKQQNPYGCIIYLDDIYYE